MNREGQELHLQQLKPELEMPSPDAAILAHTLVYGATGANLFAGLEVRVRGAILHVGDNGLHCHRDVRDDDFAVDCLACSGSPSSRNQNS
jgi:hypothetical protein